MNLSELTWTCHICKKERPDRFISVHTKEMKELPGAKVNIRYCNDNPECVEGTKTFSFFNSQ